MLNTKHLINISDDKFTLKDQVPVVQENGRFVVATTFNRDVSVVFYDSIWMVLTRSDEELEETIKSLSEICDEEIDVNFEFDDIRRAEREVMHWLKGEK